MRSNHFNRMFSLRGTGCLVVLLATSAASAQTPQYTYTSLGKPANAYSVVGERLNNLGHVAGWSQYIGQGEPSLRGWVWTPENGFTILPPPPGFLDGRSRAVVINDHGVVAGDGGYDSGLAWRYENGQYTVTGGVNGMPIAYLGGINNAGDIAGTARDAQLITPDYAFVDLRAGGLLSITPSGGSATDLNDQGQVCGYTNPVSGPFEAFRWDASGGLQPLGVLGLDNSLAYRMNDLGDVVGAARSASGNTSRAWVFTDALGMQELPAPFPNSSAAIGINNRGHVVGMSARSGPDLAWLWTGGSGVTEIATLFDPRAVNVNVISVLDINDAGQILLEVFDNNAVDFRTAILTPPPAVGDTNCDGTVDAFDIEPFTLALTDPNGYAGQYPNCDIRNVDINGDGVVDAFDIEPFVELLTP